MFNDIELLNNVKEMEKLSTSRESTSQQEISATSVPHVFARGRATVHKTIPPSAKIPDPMCKKYYIFFFFSKLQNIFVYI